MSSSLVAALRRDLITSSFSVETVGRLWGDEAAAALHRGQRMPALRALARRRAERAAVSGGAASAESANASSGAPPEASTGGPTAASRSGSTDASSGAPTPASKAETLAALFVLNVPVSRREVDAALPILRSEGAERLGLIGVAGAAATTREINAGAWPALSDDAVGEPAVGNSPPPGSSRDAPDAEQLVALLDLRPYSFVDALGAGSWWIVSDLGELALGGRPLGVDHVLGVGGASTTLSGLMINEPVGRVLDLGTGCGIQAMHASRHARAVVATDISQRAIELAALNAELNAIDNIEFRLGSLFEPVAGETFDQIVSNPPFVITPRQAGVPLYEYRDGGLPGDSLVELVMRGCEQHLAPGGIAQLLGNWEYRGGGAAGGASSSRPGSGGTALGGPAAGGTALGGAASSGTSAGAATAPAASRSAVTGAAADGLDRVRGWMRDSALDAWVIERELQDAPQYAETWIRDGGTRPGTPEFDALYAAWLDDFDSRGVTHVGFGYVLLRRSGAGHPMRRFERQTEARGSNPAGLGQYFATSLEGYDWQHALSDEALLASTVTYAPDVTEERHYWPGQENPTVMTLRQGSGFARSVSLDTALAALIGACDGDLTIGQLCGAIAHLLEVDELELLVDVLPRMRELIVDGFLLPA